jgi:hypothetical protein
VLSLDIQAPLSAVSIQTLIHNARIVIHNKE